MYKKENKEKLIVIIGFLIILTAIVFDHFYLNFSINNNVPSEDLVVSIKKQINAYDYNKPISNTIWIVGFIIILLGYNLHLFKSKKKT